MSASLLYQFVRSPSIGKVVGRGHFLRYYLVCLTCNLTSLAGPPLSSDNLLTTLIKNNVTVGIGHQGVEEVIMLTGWAAQNMRWDAGWVSKLCC